MLYSCKPAKYCKLATCAADHKTDAGNLQKHAKEVPKMLSNLKVINVFIIGDSFSSTITFSILFKPKRIKSS